MGDTLTRWLEPTMRKRLVAFARRFVRDEGDAEDVAQETLFRAGVGLDRLREGDRADAWLFRICRHAAIDLVRSRQVRRRLWGPMPFDDELCAPPAPRPVGSVDLDLRSLPAHQRLIVELHYGRGLSQATLCRMSGLRASALRVRLYRARSSLAGIKAGERDGR